MDWIYNKSMKYFCLALEKKTALHVKLNKNRMSQNSVNILKNY